MVHHLINLHQHQTFTNENTLPSAFPLYLREGDWWPESHIPQTRGEGDYKLHRYNAVPIGPLWSNAMNMKLQEMPEPNRGWRRPFYQVKCPASGFYICLCKRHLSLPHLGDAHSLYTVLAPDSCKTCTVTPTCHTRWRGASVTCKAQGKRGSLRKRKFI